MKKILATLLLAAFSLVAFADEGMWIPMLLGKNEAAMQKAGMRISAADIYDVNHACLKDAIILFNQGCTGEFVSDQGLFLTNHHCGYSYITRYSTVKNDYLTNGFWAQNRKQEIPCSGLTATRLVYMEDVTGAVLEGINDNTAETDREAIVERNIEKICERAVQGTHYKAIIKPFYYGNQYFMYVNEVFTDVRLVGAPPSNIGKFGGDTDNWMWPRHTGDFSMFRVYVGKDGKPAAYSKDNVPYKPLKHLDISLKGVEEGDFTFVFGYPGTTRRYVTSDAVDLAANVENPVRIGLRDIRLKHYKEAMEQSPAQRLKYASKVASIANGWKKWQGETLGINRLDGVGQKKAFEQKYRSWADYTLEYRKVLPQLEENYALLRPVALERVYFNEAVMASDFMNRAYALWQLQNIATDEAMAQEKAAQLLKSNENYNTDFALHSPVDRAIFVETFLYMWRAGYAPYLSNGTMAKQKKTNMGEVEVQALLESIYDNSMLNHRTQLDKVLSNYKSKNAKALANDPAVQLFDVAYAEAYADEKREAYSTATNNINRLMRLYVKGMMEHQPEAVGFPDANLTLRVTYGKVQGFRPNDGVYYKPYSTLKGIIAKENPDVYDYVVEDKLKALYHDKAYGRYANKQGELPVCFIATNHTTGGNSGSPVLNADGQLVGINFDRCWEGTMSDLLFDPEFCRNISLDIRYCLFIIEKFAGAKHLVDEMSIVE